MHSRQGSNEPGIDRDAAAAPSNDSDLSPSSYCSPSRSCDQGSAHPSSPSPPATLKQIQTNYISIEIQIEKH